MHSPVYLTFERNVRLEVVTPMDVTNLLSVESNAVLDCLRLDIVAVLDIVLPNDLLSVSATLADPLCTSGSAGLAVLASLSRGEVAPGFGSEGAHLLGLVPVHCDVSLRSLIEASEVLVPWPAPSSAS